MLKSNLKKYWCVLVDESISENGEILLLADRVAVTAAGDLVFLKEKNDKDEECPIFALSKGNWKGFYAASKIDGEPCCVEHWKTKESK